MTRKLITHVHVDGRVFGPGDVVPAEVARRITNPDVWAPDGAPAAVSGSDTADDSQGDTDDTSSTSDGTPAAVAGGETPRRSRKSS